jgi:hypothetical protein
VLAHDRKDNFSYTNPLLLLSHTPIGVNRKKKSVCMAHG